MATYTNIAEKLCYCCGGIKEGGGQQMTVYGSVSKGDFQTALNTLKTGGGCRKCINLVEYGDKTKD